MKKRHTTLLCMVILLLLIRTVFALPTEKMVKEFKEIESIEINTVSGDCNVLAEDTKIVRVEIEYSETLNNVFKPEFTERGKQLKLKERWYGSGSGTVVWTITVPKEFKIESSSASGDIQIEGCTGNIETGTASGNINIVDCTGDFEFKSASGDIEIESCRGKGDISTASGDIQLEDCPGNFYISTASGDIRIKGGDGSFDVNAASGDMDIDGTTFKDDSNFSTASGNIKVKLGEIQAVTLDLSAASGDISLDLNAHKPTGVIQCITQKDRGRITSDYPFNTEKEFERYNRKYVKKTIHTEQTKPEILLETASGKISLK